MYLKRCNRCEHAKPGFEFTVNRKSHDGLETRCRACLRNTRKETELEMLRRRCPERSLFRSR